MSSWAPTKYKTTNWSAYNEALRQRGSLTIWFDPDMVWQPPPTGKRGRQPSFSDAAIQTCLTMKVLFGMPLRQTTGFVQSLLGLFGLDWRVPDFSPLCRSGLPTEATPYRSARTARPTKTKEIPISVCREKVSLPTMMFNTAIMTRLE